jgi:HK97 family phage prohead protease
MNERETRTVSQPVEVRDLPESGETRLSGYAAVFNSPTVIGGLFRDVIKPGAFRSAVGRDDVRALYNHDPNFVLGRTIAGTLIIEEDAHGLRYDVASPGTTWARDLMVSVKRGDISQSSFAFRVKTDTWPKVERGELPLREIEEVELFDVSPVTYPAYEATSVSARAREQASAAEYLDAVNAATEAEAQGEEDKETARVLRLTQLQARELQLRESLI